jgi:phosphoglycolate phosphatase
MDERLAQGARLSQTQGGNTPLTVIFDLDGTLVDTAEDVGVLVNALLREVGRPTLTNSQVGACFGLGAAKLVERALILAPGAPIPPEQLADVTQRFMAEYAVAVPVHSRAYAGVPEALAACRQAGWRLGVCTNKPHAAACTLLQYLDLAQWFDGVSGGDSVANRKPDPAHLHDAVARAGGVMSRAVMVGDSETDAACAIAAGMPLILIEGGYSHAALDRLGADRVLAGFAGLLPAVMELDPGR